MASASRKSFKKSLHDGVNLGAQLMANPQVQGVVYGNTDMGSLGWPQITHLYRTLTHQVDILEEGLEEAQQLVDHLQNVGVGVISTFSILVLLAIIWCYKNWGSIRKLFKKSRVPCQPHLPWKIFPEQWGTFSRLEG